MCMPLIGGMMFARQFAPGGCVVVREEHVAGDVGIG